MSNQATRDEPLGSTLIGAGWRQGSLITPPTDLPICFLNNDIAQAQVGETLLTKERRVRQREKLVVITQTCDIEDPGSEEPYVEALICEPERSRERLERLDRNSARHFVVDLEAGLVVQAKYRVILGKQVLLRLQPEPWPGGPDRFDRFVGWLARRYDRPAFPDRMVEAFVRPLQDTLRRFDDQHAGRFAAFNRVVYEVRANMPGSEEPPFDLQVVLLLRTDSLSREEADALDYASELIRSSVNPEFVHLDPNVRSLTKDQMTVAEYFGTRPIFLEYHTYQGEETVGLEPPPRV